MDAFQRMMERDRVAAGLGIELVDHGEGRAVTRMLVRPDMLNGYDVAHGGVLFTLADTAFACACNSVAPPSVAAAAEIVFVAPVRADDELFATAELRTPFGRSGIYDVTIRRGGSSCGDPVVAEFRGRSQQRRAQTDRDG
jgi:acyl-CoA thioesterase